MLRFRANFLCNEHVIDKAFFESFLLLDNVLSVSIYINILIIIKTVIHKKIDADYYNKLQ